MPFDALVATVSSLHRNHLGSIAAMDLVNLTIELILQQPSQDIKTLRLRDKKLKDLAMHLTTTEEMLKAPEFILILSKVLLNLLKYIAALETQTVEHKTTLENVIDKFLAIMEFVVVKKVEDKSYQVFCYTFAHFLASDKLGLCHKTLLINRFFDLDGLLFCIKIIEKGGTGKSHKLLLTRTLLAEIFNAFLKSMKLVPDDSIKKECYKIVFTAEIKETKSRQVAHVPTMIVYTFESYVSCKTNQRGLGKNKIFSNLSLFLAAMSARHDTIAPAFMTLVTMLYTATFEKCSIEKKNKLLKIASDTIVSQNSHHFDLYYLKWWKSTVTPSQVAFNAAVEKFLEQENATEHLDNFPKKDLEIFDQTLLMETFLNSKSTAAARDNSKKILCAIAKLDQKENRKLLNALRELSLLKVPQPIDEESLINIIEVMEPKLTSFMELQLERDISKTLIQIMKLPTTSQTVKLAAVQMAVNLMSINNEIPSH